MKTKIFNTLMTLGVPCHLAGFDYIQTAVELLIADYKAYSVMTKNLYPKVAEIYGTTANRVERDIRHTKERAIDSGDWDKIYKFFGTHGTITNARFLATIAKRISMGE